MNELKLLITGGAGCLGAELANFFGSKGHEILVLDNFATGDPNWILSRPNVEVFEGSVRESKDLTDSFSAFQPSHVIHAAATYADPDDWEGDLATNGGGTLNVVRACESFGVEKLIYLQTALGYGTPKVSPIPVDHPLSPASSYGISKVTGELYVLAANIPTSVSLRLANVCSPRLAIGPLPSFFLNLREGRECMVTTAERDFLSIRDFLQVVEKVLHFDKPIVGPFNVSSGEGKTIQQVFEAVAAAMGVKEPKHHLVEIGIDDIRSVVLSPSHTNQTYGWQAQVGFQELIGEQVSWFESYGVGTIRSHLKRPRGVEVISSE